MKHWAYDSVFYHIYPLGFCGAPHANDYNSAPVKRLEMIYGWIDHLKNLNVNALYLGPVFESAGHGYDTTNYYTVDRRLGDNQTLADLISVLHDNGIKVILDGVFNHTGRDFWAFNDMRENLENSRFCGWFEGVDFNSRSPYNDPFSYNGWNGHLNLVKLNHKNTEVRDHLLYAVEQWIQEFDIDGLRLDVADSLDLDFQRELSARCKSINPDFWLMGEVVHGDYRKWANPETLDSVTNYECYKGLYSSHNDGNYFEIAYSLNRQFGKNGLYRNLPLYSFADNHDVDRVASAVKNRRHLYPLHCILFTMPGVPSIYYGSEWGIQGKRSNGNDNLLRPYIDINDMQRNQESIDLERVISKLSKIRRNSDALKYGSYRQILVESRQFAFTRETPEESIIVAVNSSDTPSMLDLKIQGMPQGDFVDILNGGSVFHPDGGRLRINVDPCWARILKVG